MVRGEYHFVSMAKGAWGMGAEHLREAVVKTDARVGLCCALTVVRVALLVGFVALCLWNVFHIGLGVMDGGPDETMRALLPQAMVNGNILPSGYDQEVIYSLGNWSYAFYPQMLGAYASAFFMKVAQLLGGSESLVFTSGRFASVLFGLIAVICCERVVYFVMRRVTGSEARARLAGCVATAMLAFWPQFTFLSSYMNNDIVALCGVSMIVCALSLGMGEGWDYRRSALLGAGVTVSALGYWNSYGFVLMGIALYLYSCLTQRPLEATRGRLVFVAAGIPAVCVLPFFAINLVRYHDLLGMSAFREAYNRWLADGGEVLQHPYEKGIRSLLLDTDWVLSTMRSFVGFLGYMTVPMPFIFCLLYLGTVSIGLGAFFSHRGVFFATMRSRLIFVGSLLACVLCVYLSLYYSTRVDLQPQGRYVIYCLIPLIVSASLGVSFFADGPTRAQIVGLAVLMALLIGSCVWFFVSTALGAGWVGVVL